MFMTLTQKKQIGLLVVCVFGIVSSIFLLSVRYLHRISIWDYKKWDHLNKTASDFTIKILISDLVWSNYQMRVEMDKDTPPLD